ncbi:MAG TPA: zinc-finger domain-containing protein [Caulobacterales bacterium]|jgi:uncharacterized Zn-finger protein|nr:zinc-finger domain-containing protein [Caulobacterales bacterium]
MSSIKIVPPPPEVVEVTTHRVSCEGIGGALGHPRVYIEIGSEGFADCGYCDRRFVYKPGAGGSGH